MMPGNPKLIVDIITDASRASNGIDQATTKFGKFEAGVGRLAAPAAAVLGGIAALGVAALGAASDLEQAAGSVEAVFGASANQIKEWASTASTSVGLSSAEYQQFAARVGGQLKNLGVPMDQVAGKTDEMIRLGADLAATYGGTTAEAVAALGSAFRGEADPAERYNLMLNQTTINAELAARGLDGLTGANLTAAKAQVVMELATKQSADALGQFEAQGNTLAVQQQQMSAATQDLAAAFGTALLPIVTPLVAALAGMVRWLTANRAAVMPVIGVVAALAAGILALNVALAAGRAVAGIYAAVQATIAAVSYGTAGATYALTGATIAQRVAQIAAIVVMKAITAAQWLWNAAMSANPIGIIILAVAALVAAFIWLWNNVEGFRNFFIGIWAGIQAAVGAVVTWFRSAWDAVSKFFKQVWQVAVFLVIAYFQIYINVISAIINAVRAVVGAVAKFFSDAWKNATKFVTDVIRNLQSVFISVFNAIMGPIRAVIGFFNQIVGAIQNVISWLGRIKIPDVFGAIGNFFGGGQSVVSASVGFAAAATGVPVVSGRALTAVSPRALNGVGSGGGTVININGGLDSADTIARRVRQVLESRDRRESGVRIARATR
jgi:phage-related protein